MSHRGNYEIGLPLSFLMFDLLQTLPKTIIDVTGRWTQDGMVITYEL